MAGLFETIRVRRGGIPFLDAHLARLTEGLEVEGLPPPEPGLADRILAHSAAGECIVRVTVDERGERIDARAVPEPAPLRVVFSGTPHRPYPRKSTDREVFEQARSRVVPYRADEVLLLTRDGYLAEGCITSIFFWYADVLCTPSLDLGILPGVGRARLLTLALEGGLKVREGEFRKTEVEGLPMFLVNSVRGLVDVTRHGEWHRGGDDRTRRLAEAFWG